MLHDLDRNLLVSNTEGEDQELEQRMVICMMCSHIRTGNDNGVVCSACNCSLLIKARDAEEMCPELKWEGDVVKAAAKETNP